MRGRDDDTGEYLGPSRKQQRREALDVLALVQTLGELSDAQLEKAHVPEHLLPHFAELRRIAAHGARKRQHAYIAKQLRREDEATLDAIRDALEAGGEAARQETALLHRAEAWRERLLAEGDAALSELLEAHPSADRQEEEDDEGDAEAKESVGEAEGARPAGQSRACQQRQGQGGQGEPIGNAPCPEVGEDRYRRGQGRQGEEEMGDDCRCHGPPSCKGGAKAFRRRGIGACDLWRFGL